MTNMSEFLRRNFVFQKQKTNVFQIKENRGLVCRPFVGGAFKNVRPKLLISSPQPSLQYPTTTTTACTFNTSTITSNTTTLWNGSQFRHTISKGGIAVLQELIAAENVSESSIASFKKAQRTATSLAGGGVVTVRNLSKLRCDIQGTTRPQYFTQLKIFPLLILPVKQTNE